ncbi:BCD family MFS transporter [Ahrensia sp. R2A130]|uniref:BCD family MFS transporter n=1 Tax=Ahrensia sp. R2A130 TaxID=744979 RepID=UPI0001E08C76|nr:BCD family MFS transporter [Ahrensia sp. R2A130]EFL89099.1 bacteriochlorophyll synthase 44.5 kDa chain [Ahrensia sp. R2A130]
MSALQANPAPLGWFGIFRLGLVQAALGAVVVLTTSALNRIMVVEYSLAATIPGALVGFHYAIQLSRPRWGYGSDMGGSRTRWIIGGMGILAIGGVLAAVGTALMGTSFVLGLSVSILAFTLIGIGVGASGTSLLTLLAIRVAPQRRPAAASMVWIMMIAGFIVTTIAAGAALDPYSPERLVMVSATVSAIAMVVACLAVYGIEQGARQTALATSNKPSFKEAFTDVWQDDRARNFTIFVFVSMLAYSAQDLILEPFAGQVFGFTPGESTQLSGHHSGGVMAGMIVVAIAGSAFKFGSLRLWAVGGCITSAIAFVGLTMAAQSGGDWPLKANVFALGIANGAFAVAAIGSMMGLARAGKAQREGTRMGTWGAAQAIAVGLGGFAGTVAVDIARLTTGSVPQAYGAVFACEAVLFVVAAIIAFRVAPSGEINMTQAADADAYGMQAAE